MEVLLLCDMSGVGRKNDLIVVKNGFALNFLLPQGKAIVVTPTVRRRYAEQIKKRAMEREQEREMMQSLSSVLQSKTVHIRSKTGKGGKLYAAVSESQISEALRNEFSLNVPASSIRIDDAIKTLGKHVVVVTIGTQQSNIAVEVQEEEAAVAK